MRISDWSSDVCSSDLVDVDLDPLRGGVDRARQPVGTVALRQWRAIPCRRMRGTHLVEQHRLAEIHHHLAVVAAPHFRYPEQQAADRLLLILPADPPVLL